MTVIATSEPPIIALRPRFDEDATVRVAVEDFRRAVLGASVYVFDNNSADHFPEATLRPAAAVRDEPAQGKANGVRRIFADIDACFHVMGGADETYNANSARKLIAAPQESLLDMVGRSRHTDYDAGTSHHGHRLENDPLTRSFSMLFDRTLTGILSDYRLFSRRFVQILQALAVGFTQELPIHFTKAIMPRTVTAPRSARHVFIASCHKLRGRVPCFQIS